MIPTEAIVHTVAGRGITGSFETVWVAALSGKNSKLGFKTYGQGRRAFEGEANDFVWCDEERRRTSTLRSCIGCSHQGPRLDHVHAVVRHERGGNELSGTGE
jgi:hypothetical protein